MYFMKDGEGVAFSIEESTEMIELPLTKAQERSPNSWDKIPNREERLTGRLRFTIHCLRHGIDGQRNWNETKHQKVEWIIPQIVGRLIDQLDISKQKTIEHEKRERERRRQAALQEHSEYIAWHKEAVVRNLENAVGWWKKTSEILDFAEAVERKWNAANPDGLTESQIAWLEWARQKAESISPIAGEYPNPDIDGPFDYRAVPVGGPFPDANKIPEAPQKKIAISGGGYYGSNHGRQQYPFWLKS